MRQILAINQFGSFAKAAEALGMAQPSLSKNIARLEDRLKVKLFDRSAAGSELTPIGELIVERAARVISETQSIMRDAELVAGGDAGRVRLGIGSALRGAYLTKLTERLVTAHPLLQLVVEVNDRETLLPRLLTRQLDVIVCAPSDEILRPDLLVVELFRTQAIVLAAPGHPLAAVTSVTAELMAQYPCAGTSVPSFQNSSVLRPAGGDGALDFYTANDYEPLLAIAKLGRCVLVAPYFAVQGVLQSGELVRIDFSGRFEVSFVAMTTRAASFSPIISKVVRHAQDVGKLLQPAFAEAGD